MKTIFLRLFRANPAKYISGDGWHDHEVLFVWIQDNARFTALCTALLLITGIVLAVVLLRRQRKLKKQLDELTLLLKEKEERNKTNED